jgi:hypothetical protein
MWLSPDLEGAPVPPAAEWKGQLTPAEDSAIRRAGACSLQAGAFAGAAAMPPPVLNSRTVMVAEMNAATGRMTVEALDSPAPGRLPKVVAKRSIGPTP